MAIVSIEPLVPSVGPAPGPVPGHGPPAPFTSLQIAGDRCKACELCIAVCPKGALALASGTVNRLGHHPVTLIDAAACTSCAFCARVCPDAVFTVWARPKEA